MTRLADLLSLYAAAIAVMAMLGCVVILLACRRVRRAMTTRLVEANEATEARLHVEHSERPGPWDGMGR